MVLHVSRELRTWPGLSTTPGVTGTVGAARGATASAQHCSGLAASCLGSKWPCCGGCGTLLAGCCTDGHHAVCPSLVCSVLLLILTSAVQVFNPRLFVVKSYQLKRLINRCQLYFCPSNHNHKQQQAHLTAAGHPTAPVATCMAAEQLKAVDAAEPAVAACRDLCEQQQHQQQQWQEQHPPRHQQQEQHQQQQLAGSVDPALGQLGQAGLLAADVGQVPDSSGDT